MFTIVGFELVIGSMTVFDAHVEDMENGSILRGISAVRANFEISNVYSVSVVVSI